MRPHDLGTLLDECADRGVSTVVHLDRPFDLAPAGGVRYDVPALAELVRRTAGWLADAGVRRGDRVAVVKDNHWDYDLLACAAIRLGALPALLSAAVPPEALEPMLKRLDAALLVASPEVLANCAAAGVDLTGLARHTRTLDAGAAAEIATATPAVPQRRPADEPLVVTHTSGTTGVPKLVVHSTTTVIDRLAGLESIRWPVLSTRRSDTLANVNSFAHGRTFCWTASVFCLAPQRILIVSRPDREAELLRAHPPTLVEALPSVFVRWRALAEEPDGPFRRVRLYVSTYDAVHPPVVRAFLAASQRRLPIWMQGWGQTETGPLTFRFLTRRALAATEGRHPTTRDLGRPVPTRTRLAVVDPDTLRPLPRGQVGLIMAATGARCLDYLGESDRWADKAIGRWWHTGDLGIHTRDGRILLLDREVDGVPGLSCLELEDVLEDRLHSVLKGGVLECVVLGVRDRPPVPVLVTEDGQFDRIGAAAWRQAVRGLPRLAPPVAVAWDRVPRTGTGKVRRPELARLMVPGDVTGYGTGRWR